MIKTRQIERNYGGARPRKAMIDGGRMVEMGVDEVQLSADQRRPRVARIFRDRQPQ